MTPNKNIKIFVAGASGMVGSSIIRELKKQKFNNIYFTNRKELDFTNQQMVNNYFNKHNFDQLYIAAAKVGGIKANNDNPADFLLENLLIQTNLISAAYHSKIKRVLFLGSSCIYPKNSKQPIKERYLMNGQLEPTNEAYALAKITGIKLCEFLNKQYFKNTNIDFRSIMPCNLYGKGDNYNVEESHVIPALIHKFHTAKIKNLEIVNIWGTGKARREFLYVDDLSRACLKFVNLDKKQIERVIPNYSSHINIGSGEEISIKNLSKIISDLIGYNGKLVFDKNQHEGVPKKLLSNQMISKLKWKPRVSLMRGLKYSYNDYLSQIK